MHSDSPDRLPAGRFTWERELRSTSLPPRARLVGLALASYANSNGSSIRPGVEQLVKASGLSRRTVIRAMTELVASRYLEQVSRGRAYGRGGGGFASQYQLTLPTEALLPQNNVPPMAPSSDSNNMPLVQNNVPPVQNNVPNGAEQRATHGTPPDQLTPDQLTPRHFHQSAEGHQGLATLADAVEKTKIHESTSAQYSSAHKFLVASPATQQERMNRAAEVLGADVDVTTKVITAAALAGWTWEESAA